MLGELIREQLEMAHRLALPNGRCAIGSIISCRSRSNANGCCSARTRNRQAAPLQTVECVGPRRSSALSTKPIQLACWILVRHLTNTHRRSERSCQASTFSSAKDGALSPSLFA